MLDERFEALEFEWDPEKNVINHAKHGLSLQEGMFAFMDRGRIIEADLAHSTEELRYLCYGKIGERIATVRFTLRERKIRIIGAAYWRKGRKIYESRHFH